MFKKSFNIATSLAATMLRPLNGIQSTARKQKPELLLKLYDIESCPYCRMVREVLTELDLDAEIYPCPKGGENYRQWLQEKTGKQQFPFLIDPNTEMALFESKDIIEYLFKTYSEAGEVPFKWQFTNLNTVGSQFTSLTRLGQGSRKKASRPPEKLLELYSFESSPFARLVREELCELEIPYIVRNAGRTQVSEWVLPKVRDALGIEPESDIENRKVLQELTGKMAIPYLIDPNTETAMYDSEKIVEYLRETYG